MMILIKARKITNLQGSTEAVQIKTTTEEADQQN